MKKAGLIIILLIFLFTSFGCLGYAEGYDEKAKEYTSADYTISQYKDFIGKYNAICNMGASVDAYTLQIEGYDNNAASGSYFDSSARNQLVSTKMGYISQYNRFASEYNTMTMDKTKDWLKIATLPEHVSDFTEDDHLSNDDIIDDEIMGSEVLGE